jgi:putative hydrolase of the HAD superfamily
MIDALILDLGNVLVFHENDRLFREMASVFGVSREVMRNRLDVSMWDRVNRGRLPGDALRVELCRRLGGEVTPEVWFSVWNCHFTLNTAMIDMVERLVGRIRLVLLSNTHDQHMAFLRPKLPVLERFDGLVLSYEAGFIKPEAALYQQALSVAGVPASRAAFFDDVPQYAEAASELGVHGRVFQSAEAFQNELATLRPDLTRAR